MSNILLIGLNDFGQKIIEHIQNNSLYTILGYDFKKDNIDIFCGSKFIANNSNNSLESLLSQADIIILNLNFLDSLKILKLNNFIKKRAIILEINSIKTNRKKIEDELKEKYSNFIPCNFFYFPEKISILNNYKANFNLVLYINQFFKDLNIKNIDTINIEKNNFLFSILYQIPYLIEYSFLKDSEFHFIKKVKSIYSNSLFIDDIFFNKEIYKYIDLLIKTIDNLINNNSFLDKILKSKLIVFEKSKNQKINNNEIFFKILLEKIYIYNFSYAINNLNYDNDYLNFDYINYDINSYINIFDINEYMKKLIMIREKLNLFSSMFKYKYLTLKNFKIMFDFI